MHVFVCVYVCVHTSILGMYIVCCSSASCPSGLNYYTLQMTHISKKTHK